MSIEDERDQDSPLDGIGEIPEPVTTEGSNLWLVIGIIFFVFLLATGIGVVVFTHLRRNGPPPTAAYQYTDTSPRTAHPAPHLTTNVSGTTFGAIDFGNVDYNLTAGVARYRRALVREGRSGGLTAQEPPRKVTRVEIALYKEKPSAEDRAALLGLSSIFSEARTLTGNSPTALIQLDFSKQQAKCDPASISDARIAFLGDRGAEELRDFVAAELDIRTLLIRGEFAVQCRFDQAGELILNMKTNSFQSPNGALGWNIEVRELMEELKLQSSTELKTVADSVAIYNSDTGALEIGLYAAEADGAIRDGIRAARKIVPHPGLLAIAKTQIAPDSASVNYDNLVNGYTLQFFRDPEGKINFAGTEPTLEVSFEPGVRPLRLDGKLRAGVRLIGRFEGGVEQTTAEGNHILTWSVPFNALTLVVP